MSSTLMRQLRLDAHLTQPEMAALMGFSARGYQEIEAQKASFAPRHLAMLERVSLHLAVARSDPALALASVRADVAALSGILEAAGGHSTQADAARI